MTDVIRIPAFAVPVFITVIGAAMTYGGTQARSDNLQEEVDQIEVAVKEIADETDTNQKGVALNEQAIRTITESLARQHETIKQSDEKLQTLIEIMLTANQPPKS